MDFKEMSDSELLATLDDIVQFQLCKKNNVEWLEMQTEKKDFNRIKLEIMCRLTERKNSDSV